MVLCGAHCTIVNAATRPMLVSDSGFCTMARTEGRKTLFLSFAPRLNKNTKITISSNQHPKTRSDLTMATDKEEPLEGETSTSSSISSCSEADMDESDEKSDENTTKIYLAFYKPASILCTFLDDSIRAKLKRVPPRPTLLDYQLPKDSKLHTCGRLDKDTEGLLILTNDGHFTQRCINSNSKVCKTYYCLVKGHPDDTALTKMQAGGLYIRGQYTRPPVSVQRIAAVVHNTLPDPLSSRYTWGHCWLEIILSEGKNRQVRRLCKAAGHPVCRLIRVQIGNYNILNNNGLQPGEWTHIRPEMVLSEYAKQDVSHTPHEST